MLSLAQTPVGRLLQHLPVRYFDATLEGAENIPRNGGALLVGNHAYLGLDGVVLGSLLLARTGRFPRFLGDRILFRHEPFRSVLHALGAIEGEPGAAEELLSQGELVVVYPGGAEDALKPSHEKHQLKWGDRRGFARVAMRAAAPIVPVCALGIDDMVNVVGKERFLGRLLFGSARYDLPIAIGRFGLPIPRRSPQRYIALTPIDTAGDPDDADDLERVRAAAYDAIEAVLAQAR